MRKVLRWLGIGLGAVVGLLLVAALVLFILSQRVLGKQHRADLESLAAPSQTQLADGPRRLRVLGCVGCHGEGLRGKLMFEAPGVARLYSPNLTRIAAGASDAQLAAAIRQGIGHDGRALFIMPSSAFSRLTGEEVAALIAAIRAQPVAGEPSPPRSVGPLGRIGVALGKLRSEPDLLEQYRAQAPVDLGPAHAAGRHLAATVCAACHGAALYGGEIAGQKTPDLRAAAGYDLAQFTRLLRTGVPPSGKDLGLMTSVARSDLAHLRDDEIEALYAYLAARASKLRD